MNTLANPCDQFRYIQSKLMNTIFSGKSVVNGEKIYGLRSQLSEIVAQNPQYLDLKAKLEKCDTIIADWETTWFPKFP